MISKTDIYKISKKSCKFREYYKGVVVPQGLFDFVTIITMQILSRYYKPTIFLI